MKSLVVLFLVSAFSFSGNALGGNEISAKCHGYPNCEVEF